MAQTLLWYDLETFGIHPAWDRIGQFAAQRTDYHFEPVDEPISIYCRMGPDYVPDPDSCLLTGLTPRIVAERGLTESEFAARIHREMSVPGTCVVGFNTIRFDDEFVRNLFYRNFYDPYRREYEDGNTRWDVLDLVRMTHDLRPDGLEWVYGDDGKPVFRLEELAAANRIEHDRAHDALSDVRATMALARLVHVKQPRLFSYHFKMRKKEAVRRLLNLQSPRPIVHSSGMFTRAGGRPGFSASVDEIGNSTSVVYPLSVHPSRSNVIIVYDLRFDPSDWIDLEVAEIARRTFTKSSMLGAIERVHFKGIHLNRSPAIAPIKTLTAERAGRLGIDLEECLAHAKLLANRDGLVQKVRQVYSTTIEPSAVPRDPELQLYTGGFFGDEDRETFEQIHHLEPMELIASAPRFLDSRGSELFRRYLARNFLDLLQAGEQSRWMSHCASRLLAPELDGVLDYGRFRRKVENLLARTDTQAHDKPILRDLLDYAVEIDRDVLRYGQD
ncbi:MAG TPA: exodeoxyribonuclease I [Spirochaetia bacterium]|nr:exodeoxyribonuclease I [Spirochaetia bacterium]